MERKEEDISRALIEMGKLPAKEREELSKALSEVGNFLQSIARNLKEINDMRFLPIIMHQYLEYIIDSIIKSEFKHPDFIFKEHLFGFYEKCTLLRALGIFDGPAGKKLLTNIRIMNNIRNYYAHEMDLSVGENIPEKYKSKINAMHMFDDIHGSSQIKCKENDDFINKYKYVSVSTLAELTKPRKLLKKE